MATPPSPFAIPKRRDLPEVLRRADIIVAAMGKAGYVEPDWIKPGATVIDLGTNRRNEPQRSRAAFSQLSDRLEKFRAKGSALVGDVHPGAVNIAGALTPCARRRRTHDHHHAQ